MESLAHESEILQLLESLDQTHILNEYNNRTTEEKQKFIEQIQNLEKIYPGGIREYIKRAKIFLEDSKNNVNPYKEYTPYVPHGVNIEVGNEEFTKLENIGLEELKYVGFVLVAGGLGERLGYDDIKIGIPFEIISETTFIQYYCEYIKAYEAYHRKNSNMEKDWFIPLCILTSDDTHIKTVEILEKNKYYGLNKNQISFVKQEKVPALLNDAGHMALMKDQFLIDTKPHGHGDVHTLLHQNNVVKKWKEIGKRWIIFFQDTNVLIFRAFPSALGVSKTHEFSLNSITIPRKPGEALGAICNLKKDDGSSITLNVEYNQLDNLLKEKWNPLGDVPNDAGISHFPGNVNVLIFEIESYDSTLNETGGLVPEFVNPKYADSAKTTFKSPTRLECMMQEFPKLFKKNEKVGFTMCEKWFCFSTCKNNLSDAITKYKKGLMPESGFSVENDFYGSNIKILKDILGVLDFIDTPTSEHHQENGLHCHKNENSVRILGEDVLFNPKVLVMPSFYLTLDLLRQKIKGKIVMTRRSTLILQGMDTEVNNVLLDGFLCVSSMKMEDIESNNAMIFEFVPLEGDDGRNFEKIRGYKLRTKIMAEGCC